MIAARFGWAAMTVLASLIAIYAAFVLLVPGFGPPFVADLRVRLPWAVIAHLAGGLTAMALGPWQFSTRLRARALNVHRWLGRGCRHPAHRAAVGDRRGDSLSRRLSDRLVALLGTESRCRWVDRRAIRTRARPRAVLTLK